MPGKKNSQQTNNWQSRGQSLIEFVLLLPVLLLLIMGAMDFGRMFFTKIVITNAAREGANYLAYYPNDRNEDADGYTFKNTLKAIYNEADSSNVVLVREDIDFINCCTVGSRVGVRITKSVDLIYDNALQWLGLLGGPVEVTSTIWMVVQ